MPHMKARGTRVRLPPPPPVLIKPSDQLGFFIGNLSTFLN
jgi:hypothetical protein